MTAKSKKNQTSQKGISARKAIVMAKIVSFSSVPALMVFGVLGYCTIKWVSGEIPTASGIAGTMAASLGVAFLLSALSKMTFFYLIPSQQQKIICFRFMKKENGEAHVTPLQSTDMLKDNFPSGINPTTGGWGAEYFTSNRYR